MKCRGGHSWEVIQGRGAGIMINERPSIQYEIIQID